MNFESVTGKFDFNRHNFRISCYYIGLEMTVYNIPFLERQGQQQDQINSSAKDDG